MVEADGDYQSLNSLLDQRFSCRGFLPDPVRFETIDQILSTAQIVPSWCNAQPWQVDLCSGDATSRMRRVLTDAAQSESHQPDFDFPSAYEGVYLDRRRECGFQLYDAVGVTKGDRAAGAKQMMENFSFFGAPHVAFISTDAQLGTYGAVDCGAFVTAFTLAAQSLGVQSIPQAALASYADVIRTALDLAENRLIVCGISFGYADKSHPANGFRTTRAPLGEVVRRHN